MRTSDVGEMLAMGDVMAGVAQVRRDQIARQALAALLIQRGEMDGEAGDIVRALQRAEEQEANLVSLVKQFDLRDRELGVMRQERSKVFDVVATLKEQFEEETRRYRERIADVSMSWETASGKNRELESIVEQAKQRIARLDNTQAKLDVEKAKVTQLVNLVNDLEKQKAALIDAQMKWEEEREELVISVKSTSENCSALRDQVDNARSESAQNESVLRERVLDLETMLLEVAQSPRVPIKIGKQVAKKKAGKTTAHMNR